MKIIEGLATRRRQVAGRLAAKMHRVPQGHRLQFIKPCYWYLDVLNEDSKILDLGLGFDADFSVAMIERFGLTAHGVDPTLKHHAGLESIAAASNGRFTLHKAAVGAASGTTTFHEAQHAVSGSLMDAHQYLGDDKKSYEVDVITLEQALNLVPGGSPDYVKMDIEGSEYDVLEGCSDALIQRVPQWCVEYHHVVIAGIRYARTKEHLRRFADLGYRMFTKDFMNILFYRVP